jgi:hypothetical protein
MHFARKSGLNEKGRINPDNDSSSTMTSGGRLQKKKHVTLSEA